MSEAISWYRRAAQEGNTNAQLALGRIYETGDSVAGDPAEAASWYRKAARSNKPAIAQQARDGLERLAITK